ncbi:hypothetical protein [Limnoglobus roseus]|uniref:Uncharacterized protein n=1 Tax=Limnoglobus roseus TaxID=2598579 RepID=A0A5C1AAD9_9BACT|nr:hypothetical protein [Limnoglobus roseus]QEL16181.1 hypothetical protein PX52LOC_03121 [Limnoglobus roseus]
MFRRRFVRTFGLMTLAVGSLSLAVAQEPKPEPKADAPALIPSPFRAFVVTDRRYKKPTAKDQAAAKPGETPGEDIGEDDPRNRASKMHDLVTDNALNPVVAIFSRVPPTANGTPTPELVKLAASVNELANDREFRAARLSSFIIFLTLGKEYPEAETRDEATKDTKAFDAVLKAQAKARNDELQKQAKDRGVAEPLEYRFIVPLALAPGKSDAVTAWNIDEKAAVTVVFYREMKAIETWKLDKPPTDDDVKKITAAVEKELRAKK